MNSMKQHAKQYINLQYILDIKNYKESYQKWMKIRSKNVASNVQNKDQLFNKYLRVIKPIIHRFGNVLNKFEHRDFGFYSHSLTSDQIQIIKQVFKPLQLYDITTHSMPKVILDSEIEKNIQKNWVEIDRLDLKTKPTNQELKWWGECLEVEPTTIEGSVVTGKGEGRKNLGMPTANIELNAELQKRLDDYPNGVYLVDFDFVNGKSFKGAGCLGTNPHYQNFQQSRRIQVYVLHDFGDDLFYGSKVTVTLKKLIRFEGKFHTFDAFLQAMHNDIYTASCLSAEHKHKNITSSL